ncbi:unnamed protein product [Brachionus calyciflorus]|uniref:Uncharacterized protein n=1 Tax=Brachionus calyciflorus TaxID=104777 RepID=A0A813M113_9BILA|nr:unnamed protein product [Brachionus calyciflorus]
MKNSKEILSQNIKKLNKEPLEASTLFNDVISNPKNYGSNDLNELDIELNKVRLEMSECINKLDLFDCDYYDVVAREDYEALFNKYTLDKKFFETLQNDISLMQNDIFKLEELQNKLKKDILKLKKKNDKSKRALTPRPDWKIFKPLVCEEASKEFQDSNNSSSQLIKLLINELTGFKIEQKINENSDSSDSEIERPQGSRSKSYLKNSKPKYIYVIHKDDSVSSETIKKVFYTRLNLAELEACLNELWCSKIESDYLNEISRNSKENMSIFVMKYFESKFRSKELAFEWVTNIKEACERFKKHKNADLMFKLLDDETIVDTYAAFMSNLGYFYLKLHDKSNENLNEIMKLLKSCYPYKTTQSINELNDILKNEKFFYEDTKIDVKKLLQFISFPKSKFFLSMRKQFDDERLTYSLNLIKLLKSKNEKVVHLNDFIKFTKEFDIYIGEKKLDEYCKWLFPNPRITKIDFADFERKLMKGNFHYSVQI